MSTMRFSAFISTTLLAIGIATYSPSSQAQNAEEYRQTLLDLVDVLEESFALSAFTDYQSTIAHARAQFIALSDEQIRSVYSNAISLEELRDRLDQARDDLAKAGLQVINDKTLQADTQQQNPTRNIQVPIIQVTPSFCVNTTGALSFAALVTARSIKPLLRAAEFPCQQVIAGENSALACATLEVLSTTADIEYELTVFCLDQQDAGQGRATLQLVRNIGMHLNEFVDTNTSSRATQTSLNNLGQSVNQVTEDLSNTQQSLDGGFVRISNQLRNVLSDLDQLDQSLRASISKSQDIQFRTQETQVDIEDVQLRSADIQQSTAEIREDTQNLRAQAATVQDSLADVMTRLNTTQRTLERDRIAAALSNSNQELVEYTLPAAAGGQLESVREVVTRAIIAVNQAGIGSTSDAVNLLNQGDQAYNQKNYLSAYRSFAQAYRALFNVATTARR